jgi:predicted nucleotidyltransferase
MNDQMTDLLFGREIDIDFEKALCMKSTSYSRVINDLKRKIYRSEFHLYGSRMMGVAAPQSDIDVYIEVGEKFISLEHLL